MVPDHHVVPEFRAEAAGEDPARAALVAGRSDEIMFRLRHPFDPDPGRSGMPGATQPAS